MTPGECATCGFDTKAGWVTGCRCADQRAREQANAAALVAHLNREPPSDCDECDGTRYVTRYVDGIKQLSRCLACVHQPYGSQPRASGQRDPWRDWFDGDKYLGVDSARTAPDPVSASQPCLCDVCQGAKVGSGRTIVAKLDADYGLVRENETEGK